MLSAIHAARAVDWPKIFRTAFLFLFVAYPGVSLKIMKMFKCVEVEGQHWLVADMRTLDLGERFGGVLAWDSFFHLTAGEQREALPRLARHVAPGGGLLFTCGPAAGEVVGTVEGEPVFHASLSRDEYESLLDAAGLHVEAFEVEDPDCDLHTICLARRT